MRSLQVLLIIQMFSMIGSAQDPSFVTGETQDCFAGQRIHPAQVDIYILDLVKAPEIAEILKDLEKQTPQGNDQNVEAYFESYQRLSSAIRKAETLGHVRSDKDGKFLFRGLKVRTKALLLGIAEREDEPAYYAYARVQLRAGGNSVKLDFDRGSACNSH